MGSVEESAGFAIRQRTPLLANDQALEFLCGFRIDNAEIGEGAEPEAPNRAALPGRAVTSSLQQQC